MPILELGPQVNKKSLVPNLTEYKQLHLFLEQQMSSSDLDFHLYCTEDGKLSARLSLLTMHVQPMDPPPWMHIVELAIQHPERKLQPGR